MSDKKLREAYDLKCEVYDALLSDYQRQKMLLRTYEDALTSLLGAALDMDNDATADVIIDVLIAGQSSELLPSCKRNYFAEGATALAQYLEEETE